MLPREIIVQPIAHLYGTQPLKITLHPGVTTLVGPNGTGKTRALREIAKDAVTLFPHETTDGKKVRYLAAGRSAPLEHYRSKSNNPHNIDQSVAAVGHTSYQNAWWQMESVTGDFMALEQRPDLRLKVEARLQQLFQRSLRMEWGQAGLGISIQPMDGGEQYAANYEASGILQLVSLLAAIHNDQIGVLLIDEPEISLHPQHQAFILDEIERVAGDPTSDTAKKIVVIATHSSSMFSLRAVTDLPRFIFFKENGNLPVQLPIDADVLRSTKLAGLVARLTATHRLAFFANTVLLVEGPSDEIIATQLAQATNYPLLPLNAQIVPVTGKGEFPEVAKFFRGIGKNVIILADLDALADGNELVNAFNTISGATEGANKIGAESLAKLDGDLRQSFAQAVEKHWDTLAPESTMQSYWTCCSVTDRTEKTKRRAVMATLLGAENAFKKTSAATEMQGLRTRYQALLDVLNGLGCHVLRRGTIENYFSCEAKGIGKPEVAANEASSFNPNVAETLKHRYEDVFRAIRHAAPGRTVSEDALLRVKLASTVGSIFQFMQYDMTTERINSMAKGNVGSDAELFKFENITVNEKSPLRLKVHMNSPIFQRESFPFEISLEDNLNVVIREKLADA